MYTTIKSVQIKSIATYPIRKEQLKHLLQNEESATHVLQRAEIKDTLNNNESIKKEILDITVQNKLSQTTHAIEDVIIAGSRK